MWRSLPSSHCYGRLLRVTVAPQFFGCAAPTPPPSNHQPDTPTVNTTHPHTQKAPTRPPAQPLGAPPRFGLRSLRPALGRAPALRAVPLARIGPGPGHAQTHTVASLGCGLAPPHRSMQRWVRGAACDPRPRGAVDGAEWQNVSSLAAFIPTLPLLVMRDPWYVQGTQARRPDSRLIVLIISPTARGLK